MGSYSCYLTSASTSSSCTLSLTVKGALSVQSGLYIQMVMSKVLTRSSVPTLQPLVCLHFLARRGRDGGGSTHFGLPLTFKSTLPFIFFGVAILATSQG